MFAEALEITIFGMAIVFVMLILVIVSVKLIQPVRRFFSALFKREKKETALSDQSARAAGPVRAEELAQAENQGAAAAAENEAVRVHACAEGGNCSQDISEAALTNPAADSQAPDGAVVAAVIAAVQASSGLDSRQFVLRSIHSRPARRNNNIF